MSQQEVDVNAVYSDPIVTKVVKMTASARRYSYDN